MGCDAQRDACDPLAGFARRACEWCAEALIEAIGGELVEASRAVQASMQRETRLQALAVHAGVGLAAAAGEQTESVLRFVASEVAPQLGLSDRAVLRRMTTAYDRVGYPHIMRAWHEGAIVSQHVDALTTQLVRVEDATARRSLEARLVDVARASVRSPRQLSVLASREVERCKASPVQERFDLEYAERRVEVSAADSGMAWLSIYTTSVFAAGALDRLTRAAKTKPDDDSRSVGTVRHDLAIELLLGGEFPARDADAPTGEATSPHSVMLHGIDISNVRAHVAITVPALPLMRDAIGERATEPTDVLAALEGAELIDPESARILATETATWSRVFTDPLTRQVSSVDAYTPPPQLRRLLRSRDVTCRFPGCATAALHSDLDHSVAWQHGGSTNADNLATCAASTTR